MSSRIVLLLFLGLVAALTLLSCNKAPEKQSEAESVESSGHLSKSLPVYKRNFSVEDARAMPGAILKFLARGEDPGGLYALFEAKALPGFEPPPHIHTYEDETYYILAGEVWFKVGEEEFTAKKGEFIFLPRNVKHEFKIMSEMLHVHVGLYPAGLDQYFIDLTVPVTSFEIPPLATEPPPPEVMERMMKLNEQYGIMH